MILNLHLEAKLMEKVDINVLDFGGALGDNIVQWLERKLFHRPILQYDGYGVFLDKQHGPELQICCSFFITNDSTLLQDMVHHFRNCPHDASIHFVDERSKVYLKLKRWGYSVDL